MAKRQRSPSPSQRFASSSGNDGPCSTLHVQACEATIIRSQPDTARRVTTQERDGLPGGLIRWMPDGLDDMKEIRVDRFDARLLLTSLPPHPAPSSSNDPLAKIGWDDLDSDSEDAFFMSAAEIKTFKADKTRREMEENRQKRMRALEEQEAAERGPNDPAGWGDSDEEPDEKQRTFMELLILNSPSFEEDGVVFGKTSTPKPVATTSSNFSGLADYAEHSESEDNEQESSSQHGHLSKIGSSNSVTLDLHKSVPLEFLKALAAQTGRREPAKLWNVLT